MGEEECEVEENRYLINDILDVFLTYFYREVLIYEICSLE